MTYWNTYLPDSMEHLGSELVLSRLKMVFACPLYSANSVSTYISLFLVHVRDSTTPRELTCSSSILAAKGSPSDILAIMVVLTMAMYVCCTRKKSEKKKKRVKKKLGNTKFV